MKPEEKKRLFCEGISKKQKMYKKVLKNVMQDWEEENVGTPDVQFIVTLQPGHSFEPEEYINKMGFPTVQGASEALKSVYKATGEVTTASQLYEERK